MAMTYYMFKGIVSKLNTTPNEFLFYFRDMDEISSE